MFKIDSKNILRGLIIGLGILLVIIVLAIASTKVASQNKSVNNISAPPPSVVSGPSVSADADKNNGILYIIDAGNGKKIYNGIYFLEKSPLSDLNVFTVLEALSEYGKKFDLKYNNNYSYGVFVESIAGIKNGDEGKYWQYYVNDKLGEVAADKKEVKAGDNVEWRFEKVPEF